MSDQGFDFRKPPERREPKQFEPPPWEREAFDELQRRRAAEEVVEAAEALRQETPAEGLSEEVAPATAAEQPAPATGTEAPQRDAGPSEAEVLEYLAALAAEEPDPRRPATVVTIGSAIVLLPIGIVLLVWGVVAFVKAGEAVVNAGMARTGAVTMVMFGAGFVAAVFWLIYRLMKQRGVL